MIVLIGTNKQYQIEVIFEKLSALGHEVIMVDFLNNSTIVVHDKDGQVDIECNGQSLSGAKIVYHDPKYLVEKFGDTKEWADKYATLDGWKYANYSVFELLSGVKLNSLDVILPFFAKLNQLKMAKKNGFSIPPFVLTNDRLELIKFSKKNGAVITKDIGLGTTPEVTDRVRQRAVMTSPISLEMIENSIGNQPFPILLQKNIEKKHEYRVIVAGREIKAFRIDPNQHPIMRQDYRRGGFMVQYDPFDLEKEDAEKLLALHKEFRLFSGSYDFIKGVDGKLYFLEVNPAGVWAYIDQISDGVISDMISAEISRIYFEGV